MAAKFHFLPSLIFCLACGAGDAQQKPFIRLVEEAEKATADNNWPLAEELWEQINQQNPVHHNYTYQSGYACFQNADYPRAIHYFEKHMELSAGKSYHSAYNIARAYARTGDTAKTLQWIKKSFDLGMPERSSFRHQDFSFLRDQPAYRKMSASCDVSGLDRNEGWLYDLQFLGEEIRRKAFKVLRSFTLQDLEKEQKRIAALIPNLTDVEIVLEFQKLMVQVGDGHTTLYANHETEELRKHLPLEFFRFKEGLFVLQAEERYREYLGARVLEIENQEPEAVYQALLPLVRKDNEMAPLVLTPMLIRQTAILHALGLCRSPDQLRLKLQRSDGEIKDLVLKSDSNIPSRRLWDGLPLNWVSFEDELPRLPDYLKNRYKPYWFEYLEKEKTLWLQYNAVLTSTAEPWPAFLDDLFSFADKHDAERLVIDLRNNPGGNGELTLPLLKHLMKNPRLNQYGKLFVITGRKTFSAAGIAIAQLERHTQAIFVGEPAGTSPNFIGEEFAFELPYSHLLGNVSDREHKANPMDHRAWIAPALYVEPGFEDLRKGKDKAWEMIVENFPVR